MRLTVYGRYIDFGLMSLWWNVRFGSLADICNETRMSAMGQKRTFEGKMPGPRHRPKRIIRCAGNSKIKIALLVYGYSNLTWASPYGVLRAK
jgi:hypothetical protein